MGVHEKLLAGLRSYASLRLLTQVASWLGTVYVVRHLDSRALGEYGVALVVFNYVSMAYDGTLVEALVQRPPAHREERRAVFTLLVGVGLALAALTALASGPISRAVGDAALAHLLDGVAVALALAALCVLPQASLAREMAFPQLATIGASQAVCVTITTVWLAWRGFGAWALVSGQIAGVGLRMLLLNATRFSLMRPTTHIRSALAYVRFGGVLFADNVLWRWYTSLDTFLLGRWSGTVALGFYSLAQQVAELPLEKISTVVNDVSLPAYAELRHDRRASVALLLETLRSHATVGFPVFWGIAATAAYLVPVIFGDRWGLAIFPLIALSAVAPLRLMGSIETPAMTGLGRPGVLVTTKLIIVPCMTAALIAGCWWDGIRGAALAWLCVFPVCYLPAFRLVLAAAGISYREVGAIVRGPAAAAAVMVLIVLAAAALAARAAGGSPLAGLATGIAVGVAAYGGALRVIDPDAFRLAQARIGRFVGLRQPA